MAHFPTLTPEDQRSLLEKIGDVGLGGLSFIGGILGKPGRAVRGLLGGTPREALNVIPFSDALGITDPSEQVHGSDLLRNLGVTSEKDPSFFSPEGLAGFGADVLTDPLTYLSFGAHALTNAGQIAKKAGLLPPTVAGRLAGATPELEAATQGAIRTGERLGGHVGVGLPFAGNNLGTFDLGPLGGAVQRGIQSVPGGGAALNLGGRAVGAVGDLYNSTIPPLFQKSVMGQTDPIAQQAAREASAAIPIAQAQARAKVAELTRQTPEVLAGGQPTLAGGAELRSALETPGPVHPNFDPAVQAQRSLQSESLSALNASGHPDQALADQIGYAPRYPVFSEPEAGIGKSLRPAGTKPGREEILKGGVTTTHINELSGDPALLAQRQAYNSGNKGQWIDTVRAKVGPSVGLDMQELNNLRSARGNLSVTQAERLGDLEAAAKQTENIADWIATSSPESLAKEGVGFFGAHPHMDLERKLLEEAPRIIKANALHKAISGMANYGVDGAPLDEVLRAAGLTYRDAAGNLTAMQRTLEAMQSISKGNVQSLADLAGWTIPYDQVSKLTKFTKAATAPEGLRPFLSLWDSITNITKSYETAFLPFQPATRLRGSAQAMFSRWVHDGFNAQAEGAMKYVKPLIDANSWRTGQTISGSNAYPGLTHLSEEEATRVLGEEIKGLNVHSAFKSPEADIIGGDVAVRQLLPEAVGQARKPIKQILSEAIPQNLEQANPFNVAGVGGRTEDVTSYVKAGRELAFEQHGLDRVATYLAKRSQGFTPEAALAEVKAAHYDFSNMSDFEKGVMRRVIPFYNFARQNIPEVLSQLTESPGGKLATVVKGAAAAKGTHPGFLPEQISSGVAVPIGTEENGQQRYLTHLGLGFEQLGDVLGRTGPLGMLNPLIKYPIEQATGRQLLTGRDIADLHSRIGDTTGITPPQPIENLIMNSPVGRTASALSTLEDPRKSAVDKLINLATGARVSDVDVDASRRRAALNAIEEQLRGPGIRHFQTLSVRPEEFAGLSPEQQRLFLLYRQLSGSRQQALPR